MSEDWLEVGDTDVDAQELVHRVRERLSRRAGEALADIDNASIEIVEATRQRVLGSWANMDSAPAGDLSVIGQVSVWLDDCDIVPRDYVIDWRTPIIGPIHAAIRRLINAEIRRYLLPSLVKQSHLNRAVLRMVQELEEENARLRQEIARLRQGQEGQN